jgi:hypothetical protein
LNLEILGHGIAREETLETYRLNPAFRKATRAMMLACSSIEAAFEKEPLKGLLQKNPASFSLVLGSAFGELETTKDFLKTLSESGMARPMLFQNSLHNSTTGFVSIHFKFTGPVLTTSHGLFAAEHAFETANLLLKQNHCDFCVVTTVDTFLPELTGTTAMASPSSKPQKIEYATSFVLTTAAHSTELNLQPLATLEDVECHRALESTKPSYSSLFFAGQNTLEILRGDLERTPEKKESHFRLKIEKPGQCYSVLTWSRA